MSQILDMEVIDELLSLTGDGDPELLLDLINMFMEDAPSKVEAIHQGMGKKDWEQIARAAHSLMGSSGNLGIHQVQHTCNSLQRVDSGNTPDDLEGMVQSLDKHLGEAIAALEDLRSRYQ